MRRRPPHLIVLPRSHRRPLQAIAQDGRTEQRVARRARILPAMSKKTTLVGQLADRLDLARHAIWYVCRRYEQRGRDAIYDAPRSGAPQRISPPAAGGN